MSHWVQKEECSIAYFFSTNATVHTPFKFRKPTVSLALFYHTEGTFFCSLCEKQEKRRQEVPAESRATNKSRRKRQTFEVYICTVFSSVHKSQPNLAKSDASISCGSAKTCYTCDFSVHFIFQSCFVRFAFVGHCLQFAHMTVFQF